MQRKSLIIIGILAVLIGAVFVLLKNGGTGEIEQKGSDANIPEPSAIQSTYTHASPKFSFEYPKGFSAGSFPEGENSETILIRSANGENSMQILISPFDEDIVLTKKRILKDAPDTEIKNEKEITIGKTAKGLIFESTNSSGPTTEVWFVFAGHLYQISLPAALRSAQVGAPKNSSEFINAILSSWQWDGTK